MCLFETGRQFRNPKSGGVYVYFNASNVANKVSRLTASTVAKVSKQTVTITTAAKVNSHTYTKLL